MEQSSMAIQVAPLPHVHEQGRGGPMHGIDSDRHSCGPVLLPNGIRNGSANSSIPLSPTSTSAGSPNSHNSHASDATQFAKEGVRGDTYDVAHNEATDSNDTQQTERTINESERSDRTSVLSDDQYGGGSVPEQYANGGPGLHSIQNNSQSKDEQKRLQNIETVSAANNIPKNEGQKNIVEPETAIHTNQHPSGSQNNLHAAQPYAEPATQSSSQPGIQQSTTDPVRLTAEQNNDAVAQTTAEPKKSTDAEKRQNKTKARAHKRSNQTSASRAAVAAAEMNDDVLVGTRVTEGHENFVTAYNMLTGIRVAVSRCTAKVNRPLTDADFSATDEISFNLNGAGYNPSSKYMFRFKDYAPWVFRHLRDAFRLDPADYLMSLTAKYIVSELGSPGKSGSFFYYSRDYRFIIKTIRHSEHKLLRRILTQYYSHVKKYPDTLISQFYGLHRVRLPFGRKIHFVVMNNVFPALYEIHERYDLKGSLLGREYNSNLTKPIVVYKDLDWLRRHRRIVLGPQKRERLVKQLEIDARFLERVNVMDYSLLVGIHDMSKGNTALNMLLRLKEFGPQGEQATKKEQMQASEALHGRKPSHALPRNAQHEFSELQTLLQRANPEQLKEFDFADEYRSASYFYRDHGGFQSTNDANEEQDVIYYVGLIDFLTGYTFRKSVETFCKGLVHDRRELSAVPAQEYGERFLKFLRGCIGPEIKSTKPNKRNTDQSANTVKSNTGDAKPGDAQSKPQQPSNTVAAQTPGSSKQRTMVISPKGSPQKTAGLNTGTEVDQSFVSTADTSAPSFQTPQKMTQNGAAATTPLQESNTSFVEGTSTPGVAVTSNMSPSVTSRKSSPPPSNGRRPSVVVYGPHATS